MRIKASSRAPFVTAGLGLALALSMVSCGGEGKKPAPVTGSGGSGAGGRGGSPGEGGSAGNPGAGGGAGSPGAGGSAGSPVGGAGGTAGDGGGPSDGGSGDGQPADAAPGDMRPALSMNAVPGPWTAADIGMVGQPGGSGRNRRNYQVKGSGGDVFGESDGFHFLHRPVTGNVEIVARLTQMERPNGDAKAGLMFRESTAADARNAFMLAFPAQVSATGVVTPGKGSRLQYRDKRVDNLTGFADLTQVTDGVLDAPPVWLRLTRRANLFEGFVSADGVAWKKDGEINIAGLPAQLLVGPAVTAHTNNDYALATFEQLRVTALTDAAWAHAELGTVGGFASGSPTRFDMINAGKGIANDDDGLTFVHRLVQHNGDVEFTGRVTGLSYGTRAARIGLMLRGMLRDDARMASFVVDLGPMGQRYRLQRRAQDGGNITTTEDMTVVRPDGGVDAAADTAGDAAGDAAAPVNTLQPIWIKLVRVGHRFVGFVSEDGDDWRAVVDVPSFVIASNAFIGVALTSGNEAEPTTGRIENVTITAVDIDLPVRPDAGAPDAGAPDAADAADAAGQ